MAGNGVGMAQLAGGQKLLHPCCGAHPGSKADNCPPIKEEVPGDPEVPEAARDRTGDPTFGRQYLQCFSMDPDTERVLKLLDEVTKASALEYPQ